MTKPRPLLNESYLRLQAIKAGLKDYASVRPCKFHGTTARDLKGACLLCLAAGRSNAAAKR